jgi:hypothetical protein
VIAFGKAGPRCYGCGTSLGSIPMAYWENHQCVAV